VISSIASVTSGSKIEEKIWTSLLLGLGSHVWPSGQVWPVTFGPVGYINELRLSSLGPPMVLP
jgi:hypothetical protein